MYTDASEKDGKLGIAVYMNDSEIACARKLESSSSISTAELNAIKMAIEKAKALSARKVLICTDSLVACELLEKQKTCDKVERIVAEIYNNAIEIDLAIQWIPSHCGITRNERADTLAKEVIESEEVVYENELQRNCDIINESLQMKTREWQKWHDEIVQNGKGQKLNMVLNRVSTKTWFGKFKSLQGSEIKIINRLMSGHDYSQKYLKMWKKVETDICEVCGETDDGNHVTLKCKKYERQRLKYPFMSKYTSIQLLVKNESEANIKKMCEFLKTNNITV